MNISMMKCGHAANAHRILDGGTTIPACAICGCVEISESQPNLSGRKARCTYFGKTFKHRGQSVTCHGETDSKLSLPFFEQKPDSQYDEYYCGCWGWD